MILCPLGFVERQRRSCQLVGKRKACWPNLYCIISIIYHLSLLPCLQPSHLAPVVGNWAMYVLNLEIWGYLRVHHAGFTLFLPKIYLCDELHPSDYMKYEASVAWTIESPYQLCVHVRALYTLTLFFGGICSVLPHFLVVGDVFLMLPLTYLWI